ncbi:hypothetical protein GGR55DRAFT_629202 [Xylaria sp. FL0064]|nr:hypothetical protein GGR55DRAFT_629202 [Xylaria sp. FL0064]
MADQPMSTSDSLAASSVCSGPAYVPSFGAARPTTTRPGGGGSEPMEPGEIRDTDTKKEEECHEIVSIPPPNPFARYQWLSTKSRENLGVSQSPFAHVDPAVTTAPNTLGQSRPAATALFGQSGPAAPTNISQPIAAVQRRNHERLNEIVTRLQNFDGSVAELLAIANIQQQLDAAFADLDRARSQLRDILRQFETQGNMSKRQYTKRNGAARDLTKASQRIAHLTQELWNLQRREPGVH